MGDPLEVFRLDQQGKHHQEKHFGILSEPYGETVFTPETAELPSTNRFDQIKNTFVVPPREQYSWIVKVSEMQGEASTSEGLPERGIEIDVSPRTQHRQPTNPVVGYWVKDARTMPYSYFVLS